ncbi:glycosyltransferase family 4 protein [Virgibacillus halodenitrificans]|uniref:glycosyltransferase family 4 protein n=1 Tax=Virgibacillus halodenitrificans TaxID=1482 RepID=UPI000EF5452C|nr:MraY family glycosyltransferase [Virgibacillus halodenitrificans]
METLSTYVIAFFISLFLAILSTPVIKAISLKFNIIDNPNYRRVNQQIMPSMGGLAIILGFLAGYIYLWPETSNNLFILLGIIIIAVTGIIDDKFSLPAKYKFLGQCLAAYIATTLGFQINFITMPFLGEVNFGLLSVPITMFWIVGIINAINFIDGLDGLASGVSIIAVSAMLIMAITNSDFFAVSLSVVLIGSSLGFLTFNKYPAKIFMGDTGSMFLGYIISLISISGLFKSLTVFSIIIPVLILGVPIFDTSFAIVRRLLKGQKPYSPDKSHLHHHLLRMGFNHRFSVYIIYTISIFFAITAVTFSKSILWGSFLILILSLLIVDLVISKWNNRKAFITTKLRYIYLRLSDSESSKT